MVAIDPARMVTMYLKIGEAIFFFFMANRIKNKNRKYILCNIFSWAFIFWAAFLIFDSLAFFLAPQSYTFYIVGSIFFAIGYLCLFCFAFFLMNAAKVIRFGELVVRNKKRLIIEGFILFVCVSLFLSFTQITIFDSLGAVINIHALPPSPGFSMSEGITVVSAVATAIPFVFYGYTAYLLFAVIKKASDKKARSNMIMMEIGIVLIPIGLLYFMIKSVVFSWFGIVPSIIGHIFYILAPIFIAAAITKKSPEK